MAIQSINTLQNKDNYNNIAQDYILESLANLGQRYNIKGDSISIADMSVYSLFGQIENPENYMAVINKTDDEYNIYLVDYTNNITDRVYTLDAVTDNFQVFDNLELLNDVNTEYNAVRFNVSGNYYSFYGKSNVKTTTKDIWFNEVFDKNNNLICGVKVFNTHFESYLPDKYLLVCVKLNNDSTYDVSLYVSQLSVNELPGSYIYNFISNIDFNNFVIDDSLFVKVADNETCLYDNYRIVANNNLNALFTDRDQEILNNQILYSFATDIINLFPELLEKYSASEYGSIDLVNKKVLGKLYDAIHDNAKLSEEDESTFNVYIPLFDKDGNEYTISYTYNTNKPEELYFSSKEIEVRYISYIINDTWIENNIDDYKGTIFAHTSNSDRVSFFWFESELNNNLIDDIIVKKISTLPYIDNDNYWVINDVSTGIRAKGQDAGVPNIIIIEKVKGKDMPNILSGAKKDEFLSILPWRTKIAKVEPLEKINLDNLSFKNQFDYFNVECTVPNVDEFKTINKKEYLNQLENSIIICISPISCIQLDNTNGTDNINYTYEDVVEIYGEYGIVTTLWVLENGKFDYLRKRNNEYAAADFNYLSNINNLIQYAVKNAEALHPDNYLYTQLVFDPATATLKNNTDETVTYLYPNIVNKLSSQYNISNYNNDLNFTLKYNSYLISSNKGRNIESLHQKNDEKYFNIDDNQLSANIVTNSLYSYYDGVTNKKYNEFIPNYNVPTFDLSEVLTRNETLLNRLNILSLDKIGTSYLSYIGTSVDTDKNILTIGTSKTNINMGTDTMISSANRSSFKQQDELNIDFPQTNINGDVNVKDNITVGTDIYLNRVVWSKDYNHIRTNQEISDITYYTTIYTPVSRYLYELKDKYSSTKAYGMFNVIPEQVMKEYDINGVDANKIANDELLTGLLSYGLYYYGVNANKLYTITSLAEYYETTTIDETGNMTVSNTNSHMIYFSDGIYLPVLLNQLGLEKYVTAKDNVINTSNVNVTSNMDIITVNSNPIVLLSSSTNLYPDKYIYGYDNEQIANFTYSVFTANPMKITYYVQGSKLNIHIEELYGKNKFAINKKIRYNYTV